MARAFFVLLFLSACLTDGPQSHRSSLTGVLGLASRTLIVSTQPHHVIYGRVILVDGTSSSRFALQFARAFDGVHFGLKIHSVWSSGQKLAFETAQQGSPFCRGVDCNSELLGTLIFSEQEFTTFSKIGLSARIIGPEVAIDVTVPAHLFRETLDIATARQFR
ncbi:MAG: hypothetical protein JJ894_06415 [Dinoroseobacter sp.]|nr:hypothetical protein [Dinoroseobacter sp.]